MKGSEIVVKLLIYSGVDKVFGYPGGYILDIYDSLARHEADITHIAMNGEQSAVFAADGYARASGRLGVVLATSGPGACNLVTGIACANMDSVPLLAITGNVPTTLLGSDSFQEVDIFGVTLPITKYNHIVSSILELPEALANAISIAIDGRKGAVLLDIPQDVQQCDLEISDSQLINIANNITHTRHTSSLKEYDKAVNLINNSSKIAILCGGGIRSSQCYNSVISIVNKLNCPVVTTLMGVASYPSDSINYLGLSGIYGIPVANHALQTADLVITLGARFNNRQLAGGVLNQQRIIQIDIDAAEHDKNINCISFLQGDIGEIINKLLCDIDDRHDDKFLSSLLGYRRKIGAGDNLRSLRNIIKTLGKWCEDDTPIATDVGEHQIFTARNYCFGKCFLTSAGLGAMGFGLPAIIGGCLATNPNKALLITGDGSFNMSYSELPTAVTHHLPLVIAVLNNGTLGMCRTQQEKNFGRAFMTDTPVKTDFAKLAKCLGAYGAKANDMTALAQILNDYDNSKPIVIDITI